MIPSQRDALHLVFRTIPGRGGQYWIRWLLLAPPLSSFFFRWYVRMKMEHTTRISLPCRSSHPKVYIGTYVISYEALHLADPPFSTRPRKLAFLSRPVMSGCTFWCRWALYAHSFYLSRRGDILDYYPQWQVFNWLTHTVLDGRISTGLGRCG